MIERRRGERERRRREKMIERRRGERERERERERETENVRTEARRGRQGNKRDLEDFSVSDFRMLVTFWAGMVSSPLVLVGRSPRC